MPVTVDSDISLSLDAPLVAHNPAQPGYGAHLKPSDVAYSYSNVTTTPDNRGILLAALQEASDWQTNSAGLYAKPRLSDWSVISGAWDEAQYLAAANYHMSCRSTTGTITTAGTGWTGGASGHLRKNPFLWVQFDLSGAPQAPQIVFTLQWGGTGAGAWKLQILGTGTAVLTEYDGSLWQQRATGTLARPDAMNRMHRIAILPLYRRCLYVLGDGGHLIWEDLSRDIDVDATAWDATSPLVAEGVMSVSVAAKAIVQVTEMVFLASGGMTATATLPYAPTTTPSFTNRSGNDYAWQDTPTGTSISVTTTYDTGAPSTTFPISVALATTDRHATPVFYAPGFHFPAETVERTAVPVSALNAVLPSTRLEVSEESTTLTLALKDNAALRQKQNRAVLLKLDGTDEEFIGLTSDPAVDDMNGGDPLGLVTFTVEDETKRLRKILLPGTQAFDGMLLTDAVKDVLTFCGIDPTRWHIGTSTFVLPSKAQNAQKPASGLDSTAGTADHEPLVQPGRGTPAWEFLSYLRDTYAADWCLEFRPVSGVVKFVFDTEAGLCAASVLTLYRSTAAAVAAGKDERYTVRDWRQTVIEPEATRVLVVGTAPGGAEITATNAPTDGTVLPAEDATLAEADRPANWVGEVRELILVDPAISTQAVANAVLAKLVAATTKAIMRGTFTAEWQPQVHRHDIITISGDPATYRVKAYTVTLEREGEWPGTGRKLRPCEYAVEREL